MAQDELRQTFLRDADAALAAADAVDAKLLSPRNYERARDAFQDAEEGLNRGRHIEYVRNKASEAEQYFDAATNRNAGMGNRFPSFRAPAYEGKPSRAENRARPITVSW